MAKKFYYDEAEKNYVINQGHFDDAQSIFLTRQLAFVRWNRTACKSF